MGKSTFYILKVYFSPLQRNDSSSKHEKSVLSGFRIVFTIDQVWPYTCTNDASRENFWKEKVSNYRSRTRKLLKTLYSIPGKTELVSNPRISSKIPHFLSSMLTIILNGTIVLIKMTTDIIYLILINVFWLQEKLILFRLM